MATQKKRSRKNTKITRRKRRKYNQMGSSIENGKGNKNAYLKKIHNDILLSNLPEFSSYIEHVTHHQSKKPENLSKIQHIGFFKNYVHSKYKIKKCNNMNETSIKKMFKYGWQNHVDDFNSDYKNSYNDDDNCEYYIKMFGTFRALIIDYLFWYYFKTHHQLIDGKNTYIAPGSNNTTSDYDVIFVGPDSVPIGEFVRNIFVQKYTSFYVKHTDIDIIYQPNIDKTQEKIFLSLSKSFDTNIYVSPTYNKHILFINTYFSRESKYREQNINDVHILKSNPSKTDSIHFPIFAIQPTTHNQFLMSMHFLYKKAVLNGVKTNVTINGIFEYYLQRYEMLYTSLSQSKTKQSSVGGSSRRRSRSSDKGNSKKRSSNIQLKSSSFIQNLMHYENEVFLNCNKEKNFSLCYNSYFTEVKRIKEKFLDKPFDHVMSEYTNKDDLFNQFYYHICHAAMYSIEAYYTPCSMNVVVYQDQLKLDFYNMKGEKTEFHEYNYYIAMIENVIDYVIHTGLSNPSITDINDKTFLKYTKYFKRIFWSMDKLYVLSDTDKKNKQKVKDHKKFIEIKKIIYKMVDYRNSDKTTNKQISNIILTLKKSLHNKDLNNLELSRKLLAYIENNMVLTELLDSKIRGNE